MRALDIAKEPEELLRIIRCVLDSATEGPGPFGILAIATKTGLPVEMVEAAMNSQAYHDLMQREARQLFAHSLVRAVRKLDDIVHSEKTKRDSDRIAASIAISRICEVSLKRTPTPEEPLGDELLQDWMRRSLPGKVQIT
jgi:hypothetical protein